MLLLIQISFDINIVISLLKLLAQLYMNFVKYAYIKFGLFNYVCDIYKEFSDKICDICI